MINPFTNFYALFKDYLKELETNYSPIPAYEKIKIYYDEGVAFSKNAVFENSKDLEDVAMDWDGIENRGYRWVNLTVIGIYKKTLYIAILHSKPNEFPMGILTYRITYWGPPSNPDDGSLQWRTEPM
jgi:hypothetical protein